VISVLNSFESTSSGGLRLIFCYYRSSEKCDSKRIDRFYTDLHFVPLTLDIVKPSSDTWMYSKFSPTDSEGDCRMENESLDLREPGGQRWKGFLSAVRERDCVDLDCWNGTNLDARSASCLSLA
jgi:hypothetical protein